MNTYDAGKYDISYIDTSRRSHSWFGSRTTKNRRKYFSNGETIGIEEYNKLKDYNEFRNVAEGGMTSTNENSLTQKKRKNLFGFDNQSTIFGN